MVKRFITANTNGTISVSEIAGLDTDGNKLAKTLFELSRTTDMTTHFDPAVHTLAAIAAGIAGHRTLTLAGECEDSDLPIDRYFRNAWEWSD
jgi:hypothetical protein